MVSVIMITYNHEKYIREAIEGVLMQNVNFEVELIIADDNSPDNTELFVLDIASSHPNGKWIKYTRHKKNKGMMLNFIWALNQCKGKYIALCEGDDYWTDPNKLKKQVDFLEGNEDFVLAFHPVYVLDLNGALKEDIHIKIPSNYETIENVASHGNFIHTPTVVFRNCLNNFPDQFYFSPIGDYFIYMLLAQNGKFKMINDNMAVYRQGVGAFSASSIELQHSKILKSFILLFEYFKSINNDKIYNIFLDRIFNYLKSDNNYIFDKNIWEATNDKTFFLEIIKKFNIYTVQIDKVLQELKDKNIDRIGFNKILTRLLFRIKIKALKFLNSFSALFIFI